MGLQTPVLNPGESALHDRMPASAAGEAARALIASAGLPGRRVEAFRYSDLRVVVVEGLPEVAGDPAAHPHAGGLQVTAHVDGLQIEGDKPEGVVVSMEDTEPGAPDDPLDTLARGLARRTLRIAVPEGAALRLSLVRAPGASCALELDLAAGARATLVEVAAAEGGVSTGVLSAMVGQGARLDRILMQSGTTGAVELSSTVVTLAAGAGYAQTGLAFGGRYARQSLVVTHAGAGASCRINGAYLLGAGLHGDTTARIVHAAPGGTTNQLFKGAVAARGRGVFQGKILVERAAQETEARQNHHALMLEEGASVDAKPELEIYADNVACAHGNTIGALDERALFYMRQRGIPLATARALLVEAFVAEAFDAVEDETLRGWLSAAAARWLEGQGG